MSEYAAGIAIFGKLPISWPQSGSLGDQPLQCGTPRGHPLGKAAGVAHGPSGSILRECAGTTIKAEVRSPTNQALLSIFS